MSVITLPPWADTSPASRQRPRSPVGLERLSLRLPSCCSCPATNTAATQLPERFWKAEIVSAPQEIPGIGERRAVRMHCWGQSQPLVFLLPSLWPCAPLLPPAHCHQRRRWRLLATARSSALRSFFQDSHQGCFSACVVPWTAPRS